MGLLYQVVESLQKQAEEASNVLADRNAAAAKAAPGSLIELLLEPVGSTQGAKGVTTRRVVARSKARRAER